MELTKLEIISGIVIIVLVTICICNRFMNKAGSTTSSANFEVKELIRTVKSQLVDLEKETLTNKETALFEVKHFDLEVKFVVSEQQKTNGEVKYQVVTIGRENTYGSEKVQSIKLHMEVAKSDTIVREGQHTPAPLEATDLNNPPKPE